MFAEAAREAHPDRRADNAAQEVADQQAAGLRPGVTLTEAEIEQEQGARDAGGEAQEEVSPEHARDVGVSEHAADHGDRLCQGAMRGFLSRRPIRNTRRHDEKGDGHRQDHEQPHRAHAVAGSMEA